MKAISLFSGAGGDTCGMHSVGVEVVAFSEFDKTAVATHLKNFPECKWLNHKGNGDITKIPNEVFQQYANSIDIVFAGFPCQSFSHAGKKAATEDPRGRLFLEFARVTKIVKPTYIIGENVPGLLQRKTKDDESVFELIKSTFEEMGYTIYHKIIDASHHRTPQKRKRLLFVGSNKPKWDFEFPTNMGTSKLDCVFERTLKGATKIDTFPENTIVAFHDVDEGSYDHEEKEVHPFLKLNVERNTLSFGKRDSPNHIEICDKNGFSKTIICAYTFQPRLVVALQSSLGNKYLRTFTIAELASIQGFPANYVFEGSKNQVIKQIGNAVPPNVVYDICKKIIEQHTM